MSILKGTKIQLQNENSGLDNKISDLREILNRISQEN